MKHNKINDKIISYLTSITDNNALIIEQNKHIKLTGLFSGVERSFILYCSPSSNYQKYMRSTLKRFIGTLHSDYETYRYMPLF